MDKNRLKAIKEETAKKAVAITAAASLLAGGLFSPPAQLPDDEDTSQPYAVVDTLLPEPEMPAVEEPLAEPEDEKKKRQKLPLYKRLAVFTGFLLADWLIISVVSALLAVLPAVLSALCTWVAGAAVTVLLGLLALKLAHPERSIKELLSKKNLTLTAVITGCLGIAIFLVRAFVSSDGVWGRIICPSAACVLFGAVVYFCLNGRDKQA